MFHLLSFAGKWDPKWFDNEPIKDTDDPIKKEEQKANTRAAVYARAQVRLAEKLSCLWDTQGWLNSWQQELVQEWQNGTLQQHANELSKKSGHGKIVTSSGATVNIGGSTGGFTRAVLYDWRPPNLD